MAEAARQASHTKVSVTFKGGVSIEDIHKAIDRMIEVSQPGGCTRCGLIGLDLVLKGDPPDFYGKVGQLGGVLAVTHEVVAGP